MRTSLLICILLITVAGGRCFTAGPDAQQLLDHGLALARQGQLSEADRLLEQARGLDPGNSRILTALAKVKGRSGDLLGAIDLFREVVQAQPDCAEAHVNLAVALADHGDLQEALDQTGQAVILAPRLASAHLNRGRLLADLHRLDEARAQFILAAALAPADADCFYYWALVERGRGDLVQESLLLRKVVKLQPTNIKAFVLLGDSLSAQSKPAEAIAAWRHALALDPNSSAALYSLSRSLQASDPAEAKRYRDHFTTLQQQQKNLDEVKSLGNQAYAAMGAHRDGDAIELFRQALALCGTCEVSAGLHKDLGLALSRTGDIATGRMELQRSLQLNPRDPDALKALNVLDQLAAAPR